MVPVTLDDWLARIEACHPRAIDLGLERVRRVAGALGLAAPPCPVVTVAGTNGKGSSIALLEAVLSAAGHRVGAYTSPHVRRYNERVRIDGREATDEALCAAFARVERARADTTLTYFEFGTLAALSLFAQQGPDVVLLEVGLGGRLDAVNVWDPDVALVTSIDLDHLEWLGPDREAIGAEKAGIFRAARPAVCADPSPPRRLIETADVLGAPLYRLGRDFGYSMAGAAGGTWSWWGPGGERDALPPPGLSGRCQYQNAAGVLMALALLPPGLAVPEQALRRGLAGAGLPGRYQRLEGPPPCILDVAHNTASARHLAETLAGEPVHGRTLGVFAALADKDIDGMVAALRGQVDAWYLAPLPAPRGAGLERLAAAVAARAPGTPLTACADVAAACRQARAAAACGDRIVVFGSFLTVGAALEAVHWR